MKVCGIYDIQFALMNCLLLGNATEMVSQINIVFSSTVEILLVLCKLLGLCKIFGAHQNFGPSAGRTFCSIVGPALVMKEALTSVLRNTYFFS